MSASPITLSGLNINPASSIWRTRHYNDTTTRFVTSLITARRDQHRVTQPQFGERGYHLAGWLTEGSHVKSGVGTTSAVSPVTLATGGGTTTLAGGLLQVLDGATLNTSALLHSGGATLRVENGGTFASTGPNTLDAGGGTLDLKGDFSLANITNSIINNPLAKDGAGTLTLSGIGTQNTGPADLDILAGAVIASGPVGTARQINLNTAIETTDYADFTDYE